MSTSKFMDSEEVDVEIPSLQSENAPLVKPPQSIASQQQNDEAFGQNTIERQEEAKENAERLPDKSHRREAAQKNSVSAVHQEQKPQESLDVGSEYSEDDEVSVEVPVNMVVLSEAIKPKPISPPQLPLAQVPIDVPSKKVLTWTQKATPSQCTPQPSSDSSTTLHLSKIEQPKIVQELSAQHVADSSLHQNEGSSCPDEVDVEFDLSSADRASAGRLLAEVVQYSAPPAPRTAETTKKEKADSASVCPSGVLKKTATVPEQKTKPLFSPLKESTTNIVKALHVKSPLKEEAKVLPSQPTKYSSLVNKDREDDEDDDDDEDDET